MAKSHRARSGGGGGAPDTSSARASGGGGVGNAAMIQQMASQGAQGGGQQLPHMQQIQAAFGEGHDMSQLRAFIGGSSTEAAAEMGAGAWLQGDQAGFAQNPDLHQAAHEAAHFVMQGVGQTPAGGVGRDNDSHEQHADQVADRVVAGQSAQDLLPANSQANSSSNAVQFDRSNAPDKEVSSQVLTRLGHAKKGIDETKRILSFGGGNQLDALKDTNFNSYFRMAAMRDPECWTLDGGLHSLARQYPEALTAAKGELAQGGNCGEHAAIAFDFLRRTAGDQINRSAKEGLDHAFVVIGDTKGDKDDELVVCDPWPTDPTACLWEDHFAFTADRAELNVSSTTASDERDVKAALAAGLKLSPKGHAWIKHALSDEETKEQVDKGTEGDKPWIWQHANAASTHYNYIEKEEQPAAGDGGVEGGQEEESQEDQDPEYQRYLEWLQEWSPSGGT